MVAMRTMLAYLWEDPARVVWFLVCCAVTLLLAWRMKTAETVRLRDRLALPSMLIVLLTLNPVSAHFLLKSGVETQALRFIWLIPAAAFMACATVLMVDLLRPQWAKVLAGIVVPAAILISCGSFTRAKLTWVNATPNWYKIPPIVIQLCDDIAADDTYAEKKAIFPMPLNIWVRQYRAEIEMPFAWYGHDWYDETRINLFNAMMPAEGEPIDLDVVGENAVRGGYTYIVLAEDGDYTGDLADYGYTVMERAATDQPLDESKYAIQWLEAYDKTYVVYRLDKEVQP